MYIAHQNRRQEAKECRWHLPWHPWFLPVGLTFWDSPILWVLILGQVVSPQVLKVTTWRFGEGLGGTGVGRRSHERSQDLEVGKDIETLGDETGEQPVEEMDVARGRRGRDKV